ncbi:MAG: ABC transporter permease [Clostridiales bacterium]|nr:ABC transporter permease [Clostridiales bacterium]
MRRNLRLIHLLIKYKFSRMMAFRVSFFGAFLSDGALFLIQLLTFEAVYSQVDSIGGWSRGHMILFVGTFSMINALNMLIYFFGIVDLPGKIRRGDLDQYLTKPMNPLLRLTFENVNPGSFPLVILSVLILCYGLSVAGIRVSLGLILGYASLVLLMTLLWYDLELILRTIPFLVISADGIMRLEEQMLQFSFKVPGVLYKGIMRLLFYFILPYGIMSTVPTQFITRSLEAGSLWAAVATVLFFTWFALWFWRFGLRKYQSASS